MWESPINIISKQLSSQSDGEVLKAVREVGIVIDKEELIKCIQYDRNQYDKGYKDGKTEALKTAFELADCKNTECWDCAFGDADVVCRLKRLLKEQNNE